ncbi:MAG: RND transporter [Rhodopseudomonas sp.]|nr:RND transporter [Rhodopseudomonas sp.]
MRKLTLTAVALLISATAAWSQMQMTTGEVRKIDEAAGKITIKHGPMKKFDMDAPMAMVYRVKDPAMLKSVKVGEKINFDADRLDGVFTVTKIEKAK